LEDNVEDLIITPKNLGEKFFQSIFALGSFWGGVSRYAAFALTVVLSAGHSDINRFRSWSPVATGNQSNRAKNFQMLLRQMAPLTFFIHVQSLRDPLCVEIPHVQIFMNDGLNPLT